MSRPPRSPRNIWRGLAYVYGRQSSLRQVQGHLEGQRRQFALVDWALARSWPRKAVVVVDEDQGKSGVTARTRTGVCPAGAEAGIVIALVVTRLARNSPDWHLLIDRCRSTGTLIADEQTV